MKQKHISLNEYLTPKNRDIPLVKLPSSLNPYDKKGISIYAYIMFMNPLLNVKAIPSYYLIQHALKHNASHIIESSSGNTAVSMSVFARVFGDISTTAIVSSEVLSGKLSLLKNCNTIIQYNDEPICPDPNDPNSSINIAKLQAKSGSYYNPGQYDNDNNRMAHYTISGSQLWNKLSTITDFVVSLGTTGTALGISTYLKEKNKHVTTIGVVRKENNPIPGPRTRGLLSHIAFNWAEYIDHMHDATTYDAYAYSKKLCTYGILGGPSSGMQYNIALDIAKKYHDKGCKNKHIVFVCCDSMLPYAEEYDTILNTKNDIGNDTFIKNMEEFNKLLQKYSAIEIIDLRCNHLFTEYHIKNSRNICFQHIDEYIELTHDANKVFLFICAFGSKSAIISKYMQSLGYKSFSLSGGIVERHNQGYDLCKNMKCSK